MITPCIALVPRQRVQVEKLVAHCLALDGTRVKVVPVFDEQFKTHWKHNEVANRAAYSLRCVALAMRGQPFMWLEPDSIPIKKGWLAALEAEYWRAGKLFMLSSDTHPPHDMVGGIGIYSGETDRMIPTDFQQSGFDLWLLNHYRPQIHFTPLIQHSYGRYGGDGRVKHWHTFPRDKAMLRRETVIFHADKKQTLLAGHTNKFFHTGDLGDIVACLPVIRQLGGGDLIIGDSHSGYYAKTRETMRGKRYAAIEPLLQAVPYLNSVEFSECPHDVDFDFSSFRADGRDGENLCDWQARHVGIDKPDLAKWLDVKPAEASKGRVVVARSPRYHNGTFPWRDFVAKYQDKMLFVGFREEHIMFQKQFGTVEFKPTANLLEVAQLIAGSDLFIGNQSCPAWLAMGMAHPLVMEVCVEHPNSIVARSNAKFMFKGT